MFYSSYGVITSSGQLSCSPGGTEERVQMDVTGLLVKKEEAVQCSHRKRYEHSVSQIPGQILSTHLRKTSRWQINIAALME